MASILLFDNKKFYVKKQKVFLASTDKLFLDAKYIHRMTKIRRIFVSAGGEAMGAKNFRANRIRVQPAPGRSQGTVICS
jgi:hypothetical protein